MILADGGHRSVGGDLLLNFPLFYGQATVGVGTVIIPYIGVAYTRGGGVVQKKTKIFFVLRGGSLFPTMDFILHGGEQGVSVPCVSCVWATGMITHAKQAKE